MSICIPEFFNIHIYIYIDDVIAHFLFWSSQKFLLTLTPLPLSLSVQSPSTIKSPNKWYRRLVPVSLCILRTPPLPSPHPVTIYSPLALQSKPCKNDHSHSQVQGCVPIQCLRPSFTEGYFRGCTHIRLPCNEMRRSTLCRIFLWCHRRCPDVTVSPQIF